MEINLESFINWSWNEQKDENTYISGEDTNDTYNKIEDLTDSSYIIDNVEQSWNIEQGWDIKDQ